VLKRLLALLVLVFFLYTPSIFADLEGFASDGNFGFGGDVYRVTNLNNSGAGSLRDACSQSDRFIVFETSGTINLSSGGPIYLDNVDSITIAGQTAPSPGIQLKGAGIWIVNGSHDILIQHLFIRPGDDYGGQNPDHVMGMRMSWSDTYEEVYNIVIDHCSLEWGIDGNANIYCQKAHDITYSNCIMAECLGSGRNFAMQPGTGTDGPDDISIIKNLIATTTDRNPLIKGGCEVEVINNLIYNCYHHVIHIGDGDETGMPAKVSIIGNSRKIGPYDKWNYNYIAEVASHVATGTELYASDNVCVAGAGSAGVLNGGGGIGFNTKC